MRALIEARAPAWREYVSARLWDFYEREYPPELRVPLPGARPPMHGVVPLGTRFVCDEDPDTVLVLRADGKWRPEALELEMAKSLGD